MPSVANSLLFFLTAISCAILFYAASYPKLLVMKSSFKASLILFSIVGLTVLSSSSHKPAPKKPVQRKIQAAILLDVSSSMEGLIEQAKAQLWNMVNTMGKAKCPGDLAPKIEIALYEYGRTTNDVKAGYVKQINGFINDLDSLSQNLFSLKTDGGDEFCGHVIYSSLRELQWDTAPENYKVIFIAGNEEFLQGDIQYTRSCTEAKQKGVIVNTIYCGDRIQGIREHWNLAGECGNGSFTSINQNEKMEEIPTPYDSMIYVMNDKLNRTYLAYGTNAVYFSANQSKQDMLNTTMSKSAGIKRIKAKSNGAVYQNSQWDLVDAKAAGDKDLLKNIDKNILPDSLKNKTTAELEKIVDEKAKERDNIQKEIMALNTQRDAYIVNEKKNAINKNNAATLETEVEKIIKEQAKRFNMVIQ
jgi:hypothetical protein